MLIECKIRRRNGTRASIEGTEYHFQPDDEGRHVAEVKDEKHAARFLQISEGYRAVEGKAKLPGKVEPKSQKTVQPQPQGEGAGEGEADTEAGVELSREDLAVKYKEKYGRKPPAKWTAERIAKDLE